MLHAARARLIQERAMTGPFSTFQPCDEAAHHRSSPSITPETPGTRGSSDRVVHPTDAQVGVEST